VSLAGGAGLAVMGTVFPTEDSLQRGDIQQAASAVEEPLVDLKSKSWTARSRGSSTGSPLEWPVRPRWAGAPGAARLGGVAQTSVRRRCPALSALRRSPANRRRAHAGRDPAPAARTAGARRPGRGQPIVAITAGAGRLLESAQLGRSSPRTAWALAPLCPPHRSPSAPARFPVPEGKVVASARGV
jgi:hypothetical protein